MAQHLAVGGGNRGEETDLTVDERDGGERRGRGEQSRTYSAEFHS